MKHILSLTLSAAVLCVVAACSKTGSEPVNPDAGKELIQFYGGETALTKAAFSSSSETIVRMRIKAESKTATAGTRYTETFASAAAVDGAELYGATTTLSFETGGERYWDDAFGRESILSFYAFAIPGLTDKAKLPDWSKGGWKTVSETTNPNWFTDEDAEDNSVAWSVQTEQGSKEILALEDLTYSNNIQEGGIDGRMSWRISASDGSWVVSKEDGPLTWTPKTQTPGETTGKFDFGWLYFEHALAKMEIHILEDNGFDHSSNADFTWTNTTSGPSLKLLGFNTAGKFNVTTGKWSDQTSSDITKVYELPHPNAAAPKTHRVLQAYIIPGTNLYTESGNVLEFEIDNAKYYVTGTQIAKAIRDYSNAHSGKLGNFTTTEKGMIYQLNLKVAKKQIADLTASVLEWETINSEDIEPRNTYVTFSMEERGNQLTDSDAFNLYRSAKTSSSFIDQDTEANYDWFDGYDGPAEKSWNSTTGWSTNWYWENNLTYYHFRAAGSKNGKSVTIATEDGTPEVDYFTIKSGALDGSSYGDYLWGAPFKPLSASTDKLTYSTVSGFDNENNGNHQITQAIAATESTIGMMLFHVTSQVFVNVKTTKDADKVVLEDGSNKTKVELLNILPDGRVLMGNGLVETTGSTREDGTMGTGTYKAASATEPERVEGYSYGVVPQPLSYTGGTVGLRITTPDGNQYVVKDLSQCLSNVVNDNLANPYVKSEGLYKIDRWYPHYKYTYTVTIKKTQVLTYSIAEVVDWGIVQGDLGTIDLEN